MGMSRIRWIGGMVAGTLLVALVRSRVQGGTQPWKSAFDQLRSSRYASLTRTPKPRATVECGSHSSPNLGCSDEREDALAAYGDALAWYVTRDGRYATKAIQLMDAWSAG